MKRELRLTRTGDFRKVQREGRAWANRRVVLRAAPNGLERSRFGFTVGKRLGKAVQRNYVKRRLREAARATPVKPGWDLVFIARQEAARADFHQLEHAVREALAQAGLLATAGVKEEE